MTPFTLSPNGYRRLATVIRHQPVFHTESGTGADSGWEESDARPEHMAASKGMEDGRVTRCQP